MNEKIKIKNSSGNINKYKTFTPITNSELYKVELSQLSYYMSIKEVKNIGVLGPFSSGKSSIINSYLKQNENEKEKYLVIPLGKYTTNENSIKDEKNNVIIDILQTLQFSRKKSTTRTIIKYTIAIAIVTFLSSFLFLLNNHYQLIDIFVSNNNWAIITSVVFIVLTFSYLLIMALSTLKLSKIKNTYFEIEVDYNASELDKNLESVIDLIIERNYKAIVFEDLDRYESFMDILIDLKELNYIINNRKDEIDIKFIYSISDTRFEETKDKTKFLDAAISTKYVLTVERLRSYIIEIDERLSERFSFILIDYIDDMRVLHSISNDYNYFIEKEVQESNLDAVFAMAIYKNLFPTDFNKLYLEESSFNKFLDFVSEDNTLANKTLNQIYQEYESQMKAHLISAVKKFKTLYDQRNSIKAEKLVDILEKFIAYGFLNENYYLSLYSKDEQYLKGYDKEFLSNINSNKMNDFYQNIDNKKSVFYHLKPNDFKNPAVLNLSLIGYLNESIKENKEPSKTIVEMKKSLLDIDNLIKTDSNGLLRILEQENITESVLKEASDLLSKNKDILKLVEKSKNKLSKEMVIYIFLMHTKNWDSEDINIIQKLLNIGEEIGNLTKYYNIDELISKIKVYNIKLDNLVGESDFVKAVYDSNLFVINNGNIENYLSNIVKTDPINNQIENIKNYNRNIYNYIDKNFHIYFREVWITKERIESDAFITYLLEKTTNPNEIRKISENLVHKIKDISTLEKSGLLQTINTYNLYEYNIDNLEYLFNLKYTINFKKIDEITSNQKKAFEELKLFEEVINNTAIDAEKLIEFYNPMFGSLNLINITNDKFVLYYLSNSNITFNLSNLVVHLVEKNLTESYMYLIKNYFNDLDFSNENFIIKNLVEKIMKLSIQHDESKTLIKLLEKPEIVLKNYDFKNSEINDKISEIGENKLFDLNLVEKVVKSLEKPKIFALNQIKKHKGKLENIIFILRVLGEPYTRFNLESQEFELDEEDMKIYNYLKSIKVIAGKKNRGKDSYIIKFNK